MISFLCRPLQRSGKLAFSGVLLVFALTQIVIAPVSAGSIPSQTDIDAIYNWPLYDPGADCNGGATNTSTGGVTLDTSAAIAAAQSASTNGVKVGFAVYDSNGVDEGEYNDTLENYGASITKAMLLVAYLKQLGSGALSSYAQTNLTGMIEVSSDADANNVYNLLTNPTAELTAVAQSVDMNGFKLNTTGDSLYYLGQSQITASDFAKLFSVINTLFPAGQQSFALGLLSTITPNVGLLQAGFPGTVYSKEGWKPEPGGGSDPARSGSPNPFGDEGAPYIVNQAAQFSDGGSTYGVAVTVSGVNDESAGEGVIQTIGSALMQSTSTSTAGSTCSCGGSTATTPGTGAPDGATFPDLNPTSMANAINTWIQQQNPNSELGGLGTTIVADGQHSNVNPFLLVTIAKEESSLADPSDFNVQHANNSFGRTAGPGQPSYQGAMSWYKWSSVKASVDYTAPENKGVTGGGDMATYIRDEFGSQLNSNNLTAMMEAYAPPSQNNTQQYIANLQNWINQLVNLTQGGGSSTVEGGTGTSSTACGGAANCSANGSTTTGTAAILCEAEKYNGIYYQYGGGHEAYTTFRQQCPEASITSAKNSSTAADPGPCATDCSGLVTVSVDSVYNQQYGWIVSDSTGDMTGTGSQYWKPVPFSSAQPGDIATTNAGDGAVGDGHVEIVVSVSGNNIVTFGSHYTGTKTSLTPSGPTSYWTQGTWHWSEP
jgi:hypothetical protein